MTAAVTQWFGGELPVNVGVYEVAPFDDGPYYSYWNGKNFGFFDSDIDSALLKADWMKHPCLIWRGLASNPAEEQSGRWVLASEKHSLARLLRIRGPIYLNKIPTRKSSSWGGLKSALSFPTRDKAERFLKRVDVSRLVEMDGLHAVFVPAEVDNG